MKPNLCIGCIHLKENGHEAILVDKMEPVNKKDTGEMFVCENCYKSGPDSPDKKDISHWITMCKGCLMNNCANG